MRILEGCGGSWEISEPIAGEEDLAKVITIPVARVLEPIRRPKCQLKFS